MYVPIKRSSRKRDGRGRRRESVSGVRAALTPLPFPSAPLCTITITITIPVPPSSNTVFRKLLKNIRPSFCTSPRFWWEREHDWIHKDADTDTDTTRIPRGQRVLIESTFSQGTKYSRTGGPMQVVGRGGRVEYLVDDWTRGVAKRRQIWGSVGRFQGLHAPPRGRREAGAG